MLKKSTLNDRSYLSVSNKGGLDQGTRAQHSAGSSLIMASSSLGFVSVPPVAFLDESSIMSGSASVARVVFAPTTDWNGMSFNRIGGNARRVLTVWSSNSRTMLDICASGINNDDVSGTDIFLQ